MIKRKLLAMMTLLLLSSALWAADSHDCGSFLLRYRVVASDALSLESSQMLGVKAGPNTGIINIMLLNKGTKETLKGRVHVIIKRPSGLMKALKLRVINSPDDALFYAAEFPFSEGEKLDFELSVSALGLPPQAFVFSKTLP